MSQGKRPGGLTALAVINFVFGGFMCLGVLGMMAAISAVQSAQNQGVEIESSGSGMLMITMVLLVATTALLIISGIGYLGLKKGMGFKMGNLYAIISILWSVFAIVAGGFTIGSLVGFIYPGVTLFLLNTTFKEDFVN